jgi:phage terminase large subunit
MFDCGPLFLKNKDSKADIVINQGGTDSGKTYAIIQLLFYIATTKAPPTDPIITIVSKSIPDSKKGAYRIAKSIFNTAESLAQYVKDWNETDRTIYFKTGWIMEFTSYQDEQTAKQGKRQYLFVNEAQGISYPIFWQLAKRTRLKTFIDYNPTAPYWAHEKLIGTTKAGNDLNADVELIISDHRHNPFLSQADHDKTENIKDKDLWRVYARGLTGNLSGLIYPNWKMIPDTDYPWNEDGKFGGIDFGYTNDPTAGVIMTRISNKIFIHELCYTSGLTPNQIYQLYKANGFTPDTPLYCEHDGDMIRQLRQLGLLAIAARKGPNSINPGISKVKEYEIYYTESSKNIDYERKRYMWMTDPATGKSINTPTDKDNHLCDGIRYGIYTHFYRSE